MATSSSGGSVLRQVSGVAGYEQPPEDRVVAAPIADDSLATDSIGTGAPPQSAVPLEGWNEPYWLDSHQVGHLGEHGFFHPGWHWDSIIPQFRGPRTPVRNRFSGRGMPLEGSSWNNRPLSAGWFAGAISGTAPLPGEVDYELGFFGGFRLGWDYDYYWGLETRVGGAAMGIRDLDAPTRPRTGDFVNWDIDLLYYPWGDSLLRPYFSLGLGVAVFQFEDHDGDTFRQGLFELPLGIGLKYLCNDHIVLRGDLMDNLAIGGGDLTTMNNFSFTLGVEVRFGGVRKSYWPWDPGRHMW